MYSRLGQQVGKFANRTPIRNFATRRKITERLSVPEILSGPATYPTRYFPSGQLREQSGLAESIIQGYDGEFQPGDFGNINSNLYPLSSKLSAEHRHGQEINTAPVSHPHVE